MKSKPAGKQQDKRRRNASAGPFVYPSAPLTHVLVVFVSYPASRLQVSRKGSRDVADHMAIQMDDSDSITVSEQSEPSAECWQNMYKLLNFYSLISDPTGILEKSSPETCLSGANLYFPLFLRLCC